MPGGLFEHERKVRYLFLELKPKKLHFYLISLPYKWIFIFALDYYHIQKIVGIATIHIEYEMTCIFKRPHVLIFFSNNNWLELEEYYWT